jgi:hypothetical protein
MTERELTELRKLLASMSKSDLTAIKQMARAELDARPDNKRVKLNTPWNHYVTRGHE